MKLEFWRRFHPLPAVFCLFYYYCLAYTTFNLSSPRKTSGSVSGCCVEC